MRFRLSLVAAFAVVASLAAQTAPDPDDVAEGMRLYRTKGDCQSCHGWAADGRKMDSQMPDGANLRTTRLNRELLLMTIKCGLQFALILLLLDRHPEDVCGALQKRYVVFAKLAFGFAVDFQHAEWRAVALENDIHGTANAVLDQEFGRAKALFDIQMVRNDRFAGVQRVSGWRRHVSAEGGLTDNFGTPAHSRANQEPIVFGQILQDFGELGL